MAAFLIREHRAESTYIIILTRLESREEQDDNSLNTGRLNLLKHLLHARNHGVIVLPNSRSYWQSFNIRFELL